MAQALFQEAEPEKDDKEEGKPEAEPALEPLKPGEKTGCPGCVFPGQKKEIGGHDTYSPIPRPGCYCSHMARLARVVIPGLPHHVTQRGNRREAIFFEDGDHEVYMDLLAEQTRKAEVDVWAYCLMPNHVHMILRPKRSDDLGRAVGEAHRRYTNFINARGR